MYTTSSSADTAKMFFGIYDLMKKNYFKPRNVIVALHTGGIHNWL